MKNILNRNENQKNKIRKHKKISFNILSKIECEQLRRKKKDLSHLGYCGCNNKLKVLLLKLQYI
jgi:hypothetical protein